MSSDINLSAAIRTSLITLQGAQTLINRTQNDLSTGLKVNNAIDNPVAYFQAQALSDRASDFSNKQSGIDQGISSLSTALEGVTGIENIVGQLQGLVLSAESAASSQIPGLVTQYNSLRTQINSLALDTSYQGLNLVNGTGQVLNVSFSTLTSSNLTVNSVDVTAGAKGLAVAKITSANFTASSIAQGSDLSWSTTTGGKLSYLSASGAHLSTAPLTNTFIWSGTATHFSKSGNIYFRYGSVAIDIKVVAKLGSAGSGLSDGATFTLTQTFSAGERLQLNVAAVSGAAISAGPIVSTAGGHLIGGTVYAYAQSALNGPLLVSSPGSVGYSQHALLVASAIKFGAITGSFVINSTLPAVTNTLLDQLQANLGTLRAQAETIGSNVALLNTRLNFTNSYVNLLTAGSGKLTLADLNEEGANLLSLQTRQQLGIQALSFAGQNEKAVLSLFR